MTGLNLSGADIFKKIVLGGGLTAGAVLTFELLEIAKKQPALLMNVVSWGPLFAIGVIAMVMLDRNFGQMIQVSRENVQAQQQMSAAMEKIADKDDRQSDKLETLTTYSALQSEKLMNHLVEQSKRLDDINEALRSLQKAKGATV